MKRVILIAIATMLILSGCASARQKLSPRANVTLKDANVYYQQQNVEKALEGYKAVLQDNPDYVLALRRVADINLYYGEKDPEKTIEYNKMAFELYSRAISVTESFPNLTEKDNVDLRDMKKRKQSAWTRIFSASDRLLSAGNTQESLKGFEVAAALDKDRIEPLIKLKDIYEKELKDEVKAEQILLKLYQRKPKEIALLEEIGAFYFNRKDYTKSLDFFTKASAEAPTNTNLLMNISFCHYEMKQYGEALKATQAVIKLEPRNIDALKNAKAIAINQNNDALALDYLKQILNLEESDADYLAICALLNKVSDYAQLVVWGEKWYSYDETSKDAVRFVLLGASNTKDKVTEAKYLKILNNLK